MQSWATKLKIPDYDIINEMNNDYKTKPQHMDEETYYLYSNFARSLKPNTLKQYNK